jgi:hypothetical protein
MNIASYSKTPAGNPRKILGTGLKTDAGLSRKVETRVLYASPAKESGTNLCPWATDGCASACLGHSSGRLQFTTAKQARIAKSRWFMEHREHFLAQLHKEIAAHVKRCDFYDYTKAPLDKRRNLPSNYSLTYSYSEAEGSHDRALEYLAAGHNVAIVTRNKAQSAQLVANGFCGFPAIDGDVTDLRFTDPAGHWVALYAKGAAKKDASGFVQDL